MQNSNDLPKIVSDYNHISTNQKQQLLRLLQKYETLFDGTLGTWKGSTYDIELKDNVKPYHARAYNMPKSIEKTMKLKVNRLCKIGVLKRVNRSEWAASKFVIPKKDKTVRFISDFRELNKRIKRRPYPIPHIQDLLMKLEKFQYAT